MNVDLNFRIQFRTPQVWEDRGPQVIEKSVDLCFQHAVFAVVHHKKKIVVEVKECEEVGMAYTNCVECEEEIEAENKRGTDNPPDEDPSLAAFIEELNKSAKKRS
jgi:hypothetical protein